MPEEKDYCTMSTEEMIGDAKPTFVNVYKDTSNNTFRVYMTGEHIEEEIDEEFKSLKKAAEYVRGITKDWPDDETYINFNWAPPVEKEGYEMLDHDTKEQIQFIDYYLTTIDPDYYLEKDDKKD